MIPELNEVFHARARLGIMTLLVRLGRADFTTLKQGLGLTDGNLGAQIRVLEEAGYVKVEKSFVRRKPRTLITPTPSGRRAFRSYLDELEKVIEAGRS